MQEAKEQARTDELRRRKESIEAKVAAMDNVYRKRAEAEAAHLKNVDSAYEKHLRMREEREMAKIRKREADTQDQISWLNRMVQEKKDMSYKRYQEDQIRAKHMQAEAEAYRQEQRMEEDRRRRMQKEMRDSLDRQVQEKSKRIAIDEEPDIMLMNKRLLVRNARTNASTRAPARAHARPRADSLGGRPCPLLCVLCLECRKTCRTRWTSAT